MNKQPVSYLQTDPRWKNKDYSAKGESTTIGASGCGPTAAAMLIETLTGKTFTPVDACKWSLEHGYKAVNQGTYYAYFAPQFAAHGINCYQLSWTNVYHNPKSSIHDKAFELLKQGYYLIALMKKGNWTSGGHFVVVWWEDNKVRINDPASTRDSRVNGDINTFRNEAAYYWVIDARSYNNSGNTGDQTDTPATGYETYTVKSGDTLSAIGKKLKIDWKVIAELNGIKSPYTIYAGQVLKISAKEEEEMAKTYVHLQDVPESYRPSIQKLMEKKALNGYSDPDPKRLDDNIINVTEDMCRVFTVLDALGKLD